MGASVGRAASATQLGLGADVLGVVDKKETCLSLGMCPGWRVRAGEGGAQVHRGRGYLVLTITTTWTAIG